MLNIQEFKRTDIRQHSADELRLLVFNDEFLYSQRHRYKFVELLDDIYLYTDRQLEVLQDELMLEVT